SKSYDLKNKKDYFSYSTEILLPNLKIGSYIVYFESEADSKDKKADAYETITVTNLSVLASQNHNQLSYQVVDRKTGKPLQNVTIKSPKFTAKTNENGLAIIQKKENYYNEEIELSLGNDSVAIGRNYVQYAADKDDSDSKFHAKVEFYLDRAIYRPGQTVYYKGIAIQKKDKKTSVVPKTSFKIIIEDASYNDFKEFEVFTNEFGSFSGEFILPKSGLTGNFKISAERSDAYEKDPMFNKNESDHAFWDHVDFDYSELNFRVEEYKRPKFEVTFDPKKESFQVDQNVKVTGTARAFAGSSISDAKVTYTVTRYVSYFRNYYGREESEILVSSETKTDASGKFIIDFKAVPTENATKEHLPVFNYEIEASLTDINGETHETKTTVKVGYHDLVLTAKIPAKIATKDKKSITLNSTNLNGEFLAAKGDLNIYYIRPFLDKFKPRPWQKPEIQGVSDSDFEKLFPFENNEKENTAKETLVFSKKIDTEKDKKIALDFISEYKSGSYKIVFSAKDSFNNLIETTENFELTQSKDKFNHGKLFTATQINEDVRKDGFALIKITSVIPEIYIISIGNYESKVFFEATTHLQNNEMIVKIPVKNEFENGIKISFESVFENHVFNDEIEILLKSAQPKLEWKVESFRNKIQPGSSENWSFQLTSPNAKKEAEVLASMYDSSLDQFTVQNWNILEINEYNYNGANNKTALGFENIHTAFRNLNTFLTGLQLTKEETNLIWFGFDFNDPNFMYKQKEYIKQLSKKAKKPANAKMITGVVSDPSGLPLPGVTVLVKGTQRQTVTDFDGYYEVEVANGEELLFSYIGFLTKSVIIEGQKIIDLTLEEDNNHLEEVVVTAYGIKKEKKSLGYATASVSSESMDSTSGYMAAAPMLAGIVSGVQVNNTEDGPEYYFQTNKVKFIPGKKVISGLTNLVIGESILYIIDGEIVTVEAFKNLNPSDILDMAIAKDETATALYGTRAANGVIIITTKKSLEALTQVKARKNLSETAFFFPNLKTDSKGNLSFNFTSPEALTAWKLRLMAHNKDAVSGYLEKSVVTQKELMVLPNFPRFFREKDAIVISTKISNMTDAAKTGIAMLQFFDATTMKPIDEKMMNVNSVKNFTIDAFGNTTASWTISIPEGLQGVQYKILAKAGNFSDGEENILPVLTNNMLVTESIPIWVRENSKKEYTFENLKNNNSTTLRNHQFTLEYTSNPTWIAIQSLPYLMEYEHECAEQTFARYYANTLASEIISSNPKIATVFENWRKNGKLNSKLEENEELKLLILAETPWLDDAKSEDEKKKSLALLFDLEKMKTSKEATFQKLKQKQKSSGGFAWFDGGDENEYMTRHILAGLGHLAKLDKSKDDLSKIDEIVKKGIPYLDQKLLESYTLRTKNLKKSDRLIWLNPNSDLHAFYARSFYLDKYPLSDTLKKASKLFLETAKKAWLDYSLYEKGLTALTLNRFGEKESAKTIIESLKETSSTNEDWGMYWIANKSGWYWYQAPIETQALLIEAFAEVNNDTKSVDAMKVWLLKNKQTKNWPTTKSTTEAIYALLMQGTDWLSVKDNTVIKLGDEKIVTKKLAENEKEAETGYIKLNWKADEVKKEMASVSIENKSKVPGFGGVYWQYFEDLDKIKTNSGAVLSVSKELYLKTKTVKGEELQKITSKNPLKTGDLVTVRLIITSKEDTEYVHLKDMRASCFEPVNVLSEYKYKDGLGFYMSTKDAATHFFFDKINKGTYVIEYDIRVNNRGEFSNGITTIESMYAPEFTSHTKGIRVTVN
ncbi:MAG: alpha-2-macroglobulin, partial [Flavobacterium sp.]